MSMKTIEQLLNELPCGFGERIKDEISDRDILRANAMDFSSALDHVISCEKSTEVRAWLRGVQDYINGNPRNERFNQSQGYGAAEQAFAPYIAGLSGGRSVTGLFMALKKVSK